MHFQLIRAWILLPALAAFWMCPEGFPHARAAEDSIAKTTDAQGETDVVTFLDAEIRTGYEDNEIESSGVASDEEWVRRVYLDVAGRIPSLDETKAFLKKDTPRKRAALIDELLGSGDYIRHFTTIWTNHCIGRGTTRRVSRPGMEKFFREVFGRERSWDDVVVDIITAEGHFEENGAVNFTLAQMQMPDDAVQLTAKTTKLFLGTQVQCTQCHNHPFNKWEQAQFWQFNSFFRQVRKRDHRKQDPNSGRMVDDYSEVLVRDFTDPVYFEKRSGLMQVAMPIYNGQSIPLDAFDRRKELAKLLVAGDQTETPQIALAFVNRMWGQFFGYGFNQPVDDMGPHNPASHPEILERLAVEFVKSEYNVKELVRWITNSEAYSLTSQFGKNNAIDDPSAGEMPLFSHMYVKSMQAEQLYDSLIIATNADSAGKGNWDAQERQRREWMQQFVVTFGTDEGDESTTFNGTIPQALMMMNSELIDKAVSAERGSFLFDTFNNPGKEATKMNDLYLAALSRRPSRGELAKIRKLVRQYGPEKAMAYQDLFWALLNSNEFIFNH